MNLIKINLLPYREQREAKQKQQFQAIMAIGFVAGVAACAAVYMALSGMVSKQEERNASLKAGIEELQKQVDEIQSLEKRKQNYLDRKRKVEELDNKRFDGARIVNDLNRIVPDGAYLTALKGKGSDGKSGIIEREYIIEGKAVSDNKVAVLMAALPSTGVFDVPDLVEIKKDENNDVQTFVLKTKVLEQSLLPRLPNPAAAPAPLPEVASQAVGAPSAVAPSAPAAPAPAPAPASNTQAAPPPPQPASPAPASVSQ